MEGSDPILGYWWLPESDEKWAGNLVQHENGDLDLEILIADFQLEATSIRLSFSVEGLQDWSRLRGINKVWTQVGDLPSVSRSYSHSFPDSVELESGELRLRISSLVSERSAAWSFSLTEDTQIEVTTDNPRVI